MPFLDTQIQVVHVQNADTASTVIAAASPGQKCYVIALYYRNGSAGTLAPTLISNSKTMWGGNSQGTGISASYTGFNSPNGIPVSDGTNQAVTFSAAASVTSDLTVWWYYGP